MLQQSVLRLQTLNATELIVVCGLPCCALHPAGLFLGSFGPHGPELLSLSRSICMETGEEQVVALKLTGDPNVPAGQVGTCSAALFMPKRLHQHVWWCGVRSEGLGFRMPIGWVPLAGGVSHHGHSFLLVCCWDGNPLLAVVPD